MERRPLEHETDQLTTRRTVLAGTAVAGLGVVAGCIGGESEADVPSPITIESGQPCDNCTMEIVNYPGPVGQSFYDDPAAVLSGGGENGGHMDDEMDDGNGGHDGMEDEDSDGEMDDTGGDDEEDRPAQFCSSVCTYTFLFDNEDDQEPDVVYLTDYSTVEYTVSDDGDTPEISSHVQADDFERASELTLVVDSEVEGAMGRSMIGFSDPDDADEFQSEHGGDRYEHDDVTRDLVMSLM
ncbi:nitrous oxide reductase accessory protein NosL [Halobacteria archaeon AArc-dxtr1]|nr:nitrous oxide reductase accessory protein NosL [Halobacteria archaeon AArc-dxtr1]